MKRLKLYTDWADWGVMLVVDFRARIITTQLGPFVVELDLETRPMKPTLNNLAMMAEGMRRALPIIEQQIRDYPADMRGQPEYAPECDYHDPAATR